MASLVRPWITYYVANGRRVKKGTLGAEKVRERSPKWYGQGIPGHPPKKRVPLATNKAVAQRMLADLVEKGERGVAAMPVRGEAARKLEPLVVEFGEAVGRKSGQKHTDRVLRDVRLVLSSCNLTTLADLRAPGMITRVEKFIKGLTEGDDPLTSATAAYTGKHVRQFTRWLWRKREVLDRDLLAGLDLPSQEATTKRRALTPEELAALVATAEASSKSFRSLTGPERALLYLTAVATGYRAGELAELTPAHFDLDAEVPVARLPGEHTKNRKDAHQPIPPAVAARLRAHLAGRPQDEPVWPGGWSDRCALMLQEDLSAAGISIEVNGEEAVFHSLRHSYVSMLANYAPAHVTQQLARHATPILTFGRYSHTDMSGKAEAVARLPLPGAGTAAGPFALMSRTELERTAEALLLAVVAGHSGLLAPPLAPDLDPGGDAGRRPETEPGRKPSARKRRKPQ